MNKFIDLLSEKFTPVVNKITKNIWVQSVQSTIMKVLPMVFVGSLVTIVSVLKNYISFLPDLSPINQYTFGLLGLFIAFLLPMGAPLLFLGAPFFFSLAQLYLFIHDFKVFKLMSYFADISFCFIPFR